MRRALGAAHAVDVRRFFVGVRFCGVGLGVLREALGELAALGSATNFNIASRALVGECCHIRCKYLIPWGSRATDDGWRVARAPGAAAAFWLVPPTHLSFHQSGDGVAASSPT